MSKIEYEICGGCGACCVPVANEAGMTFCECCLTDWNWSFDEEMGQYILTEVDE